MGGTTSQQKIAKSKESNEWIRYEAELDKDKPSQIQPFFAKELTYLQDLFTSLDKKGLKSIQLKQFDQLTYLRDNPLFPRIKDLFQQEMKKLKAKRINFELFLYLLSVFHIRTDVQTKYKYLFRLYDCDKNLKIDASDLMKIYKLIYKADFMEEEDYSKLVSDTLIRFGNKGEIKIQNLLELVPEDQIREFMSFRFNSQFT